MKVSIGGFSLVIAIGFTVALAFVLGFAIGLALALGLVVTSTNAALTH